MKINHAILPVALLAFGTAAAPAAAGPTQQLIAGAELLGQSSAGWEINLITGARFGTDDGSELSAVRRIQISFPSGARFNGDRFPTCDAARVKKQECPKGSQIGTGTAVSQLGDLPLDAAVQVYNGAGTAARRKVFMRTKVPGTLIILPLEGEMRRTSGTYGYVLDLVIPPIVPGIVEGGVPISSFETKIGGVRRVRGKRVPLLSAPTRCNGGWRFAAKFTYADGQSRSVTSAISCRIDAVPVS